MEKRQSLLSSGKELGFEWCLSSSMLWKVGAETGYLTEEIPKQNVEGVA